MAVIDAALLLKWQMEGCRGDPPLTPDPGQAQPQGATLYCPQVFTFTSRLS